LGAELKLLCDRDENSTIHHDRGMLLCGKKGIVLLCHKKDNRIFVKGNIAQVKYSMKYKIRKTLTLTAKSPVKASMASSGLTHSTEVILNGRILI
jgi:hypothetical protein